jgi:hypothetical protein
LVTERGTVGSFVQEEDTGLISRQEIFAVLQRTIIGYMTSDEGYRKTKGVRQTQPHEKKPGR